MEQDWITKFTGALLDFQEFIVGKWGDENKIADYLLDIAIRLSGAEWGIIRKNRNSDSLLLAHRCLFCPSCKPDRQTEEFLSHLGNKQLLSPELYSIYGTFSEPVKFESLSFLPGNYMVIKSAASAYAGLELILLNLSDSYLSKDFTRALESFLNIFSREDFIENLNHSLKNREKEITRISDSKTQFLGSLSHEIRSPLNGIVCMGSLLKETELDEDQLELLNIIQFSADNITRIIQDLVDITMLSSGKVVLNNETFSIKTFSRNLVKNIREEALSKGLTLHLDIEKSLDSFLGDQVRLGQILSNLLQNAIKYTNEGDIFLDIHSTDEGIEFIVSDTGIGIARDKQDIIFEEFYQLERSNQRKGEYKGVGLGLAIVKDLVAMMGGTISVRSLEGKGSSFKILLPQLPGENNTPPEESLDLLASTQELRFLVVDDDEINRLFLRTILERQGAHIDEAENGLMAVELAGDNSYDMILMDISMPVMNGLDATREIRKIKENLPILAVTANAFDEDFKRILEAGLDDIILKPVYEDQLMDKVSTWLDRRRKDKYVNHTR